MNQILRKAIFAGMGIGTVALAITGVIAQSGPAQPAAKPKMTDETFKNIQVLKGIPSDQLLPAMQFITASLGVQCDHCHVQGAFDKDDKTPKQTARKMMRMMFAINKDNFDGHSEVTCYSCHRGADKTVGTPVISEEEPKPAPGGAMSGGEANAANLPAADQLLDKYVQALGGRDAIQKISSRVERGTISLGGRQFPIEIFAKAPDKRTSVMQLPNGDSITTYDGHAGWLSVPGRPVHEMSGPDLDAAGLDADLHFATQLRQLFGELRVERREKIGDRETYVVAGFREAQPPVQLYFDGQSGLLVRLLRYAETPLGPNPTQIDYADYRDAGDVKTPFRWTVARPGGRFTIQVDQAQANVPVDDAKFAKPAEPPAPEQKPPSP